MSHRIPDTSAIDPDDGSPGIRMTVTFPNPDAARELLRFLGQSMSETSFALECVTESDSGPCAIAINDLTESQLSAARCAVACGYYDDPKDAQLSDIAAELDRSESAISQHLNAVERKLTLSLVDACE
ncbi:MAG: helix-turn-helix domain-containing protein [Halapricum sp.]